MNKLHCIKLLGEDLTEREKIELDFDMVSELSPDHVGDSDEPCFRVEYYDDEAGYSKVIYIEANFKVS